MAKKIHFRHSIVYTAITSALVVLTAPAFSQVEISEDSYIHTSQTYNQDTVISFEQSGATSVVYAQDGDVTLSGENGASLTLDATAGKTLHLIRAANTNVLTFSGFKDLDIRTNYYVLDAKTGGDISATVSNDINLSVLSGNGHVIQTVVNEGSGDQSNISLVAGGKISLTTAGAGVGILNTSGNTVSLNADGGIDINVGRNGIRNEGSSVELTSAGEISINATNRGISSSAGLVSVNAKALNIGTEEGSLPLRAIETENSASIQLGKDITGRIGSLSLKASQTAIFGSESSTLNIFSNTATISSDDIAVNTKGNFSVQSNSLNVTSKAKSAIALSGKSNSIKVDEATITSKETSLQQSSGGTLTISGDTGAAVHSLTFNTDSGYGIQASGTQSKIDISAVTTVINSHETQKTGGGQPYSGNAVSASSGGAVVFNRIEDSEQSLKIDSRWGALFASNESSIEVNGGSVDFTGSVLSTNGSGITLKDLTNAKFFVEEGNTGADQAAIISRYGDIDIYADTATINSGKYAVLSTAQGDINTEYSNSQVDIEVSQRLEITGDIASTVHRTDAGAVDEKGKRIVNINRTTGGTVVITGDISTVSNSYAHSEVNIGLKTADSSLTGSVTDTYIGGDLADVTGGTSLTFENGAQWNVEGDSIVKSVTAAEGTINTNGHNMTIGELAGADFVTNTSRARQITVDEYTEDFSVTITEDGMKDVDVNNVAETMASVVDATTTAPDAGTITIHGKETALLGETELTMDGDGNIKSYSEAANTVNEGLQDIAAMNFLFFRSTMNDVSKRMGDLRTMPKSAGAWARYYGGEAKYGSMDMETQYNTLQIGADRWYNNFYYGISASVSDGNGDLANGSVDNRNYSLGLYGGWVADNGQYLDFIVKRHRVETEGDLNNTSGTRNSFDYYNWGTSISFEYGWRFNCPNTGFWVEPQAELMYGQFDKTSFTTSQSANVKQDTIKTLVGRLGTALGYTFDENRGSVYLKASVLHDWKGETNSAVTVDGQTRYFEDDLGGTWGEFALGGTYNISDSFSAYGDILTTTGSPVRTPWEVSVGVRWTF